MGGLSKHLPFSLEVIILGEIVVKAEKMLFPYFKFSQ
jgi:hypothetical protein